MLPRVALVWTKGAVFCSMEHKTRALFCVLRQLEFLALFFLTKYFVLLCFFFRFLRPQVGDEFAD